MRNIFFQLIKLILMFSFIISQTRYKDEIFSELIKTNNVVYGNAPDIPFDGAFEVMKKYLFIFEGILN